MMCEEATTSSTPGSSLQPRIVERALSLPLVSDTYQYMSSLAAPLQPYMETTLASLDSSYSTLRAGAEHRLPVTLTTSLTKAGEAAILAAASLDTLACSGLDILVEKVPCLEKP